MASHDHDYQTQAARDLAWALSSPALMQHPLVVEGRWGAMEIARNRGLLARLDTHDSALGLATRRLKGSRLGDYFETLMITWLREVPPVRLIAANRQVHGGKGTIGEFDVLFRRDQVVWHWELALKFYLGHPGPDGALVWYGPNPKDRLDIKWHKMLNNQLRLARHPAARKALRSLGIRDPVEPRAFIKGYLFDPLDVPPAIPARAPDLDLNPAAQRGWWVHHDQLQSHQARLDPHQDRHWLVLKRRRWMSPARALGGDRLHTFDQLTAALDPNRPTLVAALEQTPHGLRETTRGFVVP